MCPFTKEFSKLSMGLIFLSHIFVLLVVIALVHEKENSHRGVPMYACLFNKLFRVKTVLVLALHANSEIPCLQKVHISIRMSSINSNRCAAYKLAFL